MYKLSYIISTRNKLLFLKATLEDLFTSIDPDEEIVIIDGGSTDGTKEYLRDLYEKKAINQYISEPDKGESHAFNKGMLLAEGEIFKLITDDDSFNYPVIKKCKVFMENHPDIDVLIGATCNTSFENFDEIQYQNTVRRDYIKWLERGTCFPFTGLSLMIKKKSLPLLGLLNCTTKAPDTEFALRVTSFSVNIAWCELPMVIRIENNKSNLRSYDLKLREMEGDRCFYFYDPVYRKEKQSLFRRIIEEAKKKAKYLLSFINGKKEFKPVVLGELFSEKDIREYFANCQTWLKNQTDLNNPHFLYKK